MSYVGIVGITTRDLTIGIDSIRYSPGCSRYTESFVLTRVERERKSAGLIGVERKNTDRNAARTSVAYSSSRTGEVGRREVINMRRWRDRQTVVLCANRTWRPHQYRR